MAYGMNQVRVNPFLIGKNDAPVYPPSNILEMAMMGNQPATVDDKMKALQQNQFNSLVNEDLNKRITDPNVLQQIEQSVGGASEEIADNTQDEKSLMQKIGDAIIPSAEASTVSKNKNDIDYQAKAKKYAEWILANKDKKGTKRIQYNCRSLQSCKIQNR